MSMGFSCVEETSEATEARLMDRVLLFLWSSRIRDSGKLLDILPSPELTTGGGPVNEFRFRFVVGFIAAPMELREIEVVPPLNEFAMRFGTEAEVSLLASRMDGVILYLLRSTLSLSIEPMVAWGEDELQRDASARFGVEA